MDMIKDVDPKRRVKFFGARLEEIKRRSVIKKINLLPVLTSPAGLISDIPCLEGCSWKEAGKNYRVKPQGKSLWLRKEINLPKIKKGQFFELKLSFGKLCESLLYINGKMRGGMFRPAGGRSGILGEDVLRGGEKVEFLVHTYHRGDYAAVGLPEQVLEEFGLEIVSGAELDFYDAFSTAYDSAVAMDTNSFAYSMIIGALENCYKILDFSSDAAYGESSAEARYFLEREIYNGRDVLPVTVGVFGHAHIDVAWLWTVDEAVGKSIRTFSEQIKLIRQYEGWSFHQGQPQLYEFVKECAPGLYQEIKKSVKAKRWHPEGAAWVEFDANITGGESIVRQLLYGKQFFKEEFGVDNKTAWLPDVFGFSASLPQILQKCGIDLFMTAKLGYNENTRFPYDTFRWKGIDGSEVLAHFITAPETSVRGQMHSYNTSMSAEELFGTWKDYLQKDVNSGLIMPFGLGDGGGGPKDFMLRRLRWFKKGITGFPRVYEETFNGFRKKLFRKPLSTLPVWNGELYLQTHRGCFTTQAFCKKYDRLLEFLLERAEIISLLPENRAELASETKRMWKILMLNQFHDILAGSSIKEVYDRARRDYLALKLKCDEIIKAALKPFLQKADGFITVFNPFSWEYSGYAEIDGDKEPIGLDCERSSGGVCFSIEGLKPLSFSSIKIRKAVSGKGTVKRRKAEGFEKIENDFYKLKINLAKGSVASLIQKSSGIEFCRENEDINLLEIYEDKPAVPGRGAWDIEYIHQYKKYASGTSPAGEVEISSGKLSKRVKMRHVLSKSLIHQEIILFRDDPLIYFRTEADWREDEAVLKARFPLSINSDSAACDIQFGNFMRPIHRNTLEDHACFEFPARKWVDLSEGYAGFGIITDSKNGYSVNGSSVSITLLRSPLAPDRTADRGRHEFSYALYPHRGTWMDADLPKHAFRMNYPLMVFDGKIQDDTAEQLAEGLVLLKDSSSGGVDRGENLIIETMKLSEDGKGLIVRMYECKNSRGKIEMKLNFPGRNIKRVFKCNLLEEKEEEVECLIGWVRFSYRPYEIITLRFEIF